MTIYIWAEHLYRLFIFTVIIPVVLGLRKWPLLSRQQKWSIGFLGTLLLHELAGELTMHLQIRNHFLYYLQTLAVLICVAGVYDDEVRRNHLIWRLVGLLALIVLPLEVFVWVGFNHINSLTLTLSRLLAGGCAVGSLMVLLSQNTAHSLGPKSMLYFHLGFFLFGTFTAVNTYFKGYFIETSLDMYYLFDVLSAMFSAIAFAFFSFGLLRIQQRSGAE